MTTILRSCHDLLRWKSFAVETHATFRMDSFVQEKQAPGFCTSSATLFFEPAEAQMHHKQLCSLSWICNSLARLTFLVGILLRETTIYGQTQSFVKTTIQGSRSKLPLEDRGSHHLQEHPTLFLVLRASPAVVNLEAGAIIAVRQTRLSWLLGTKLLKKQLPTYPAGLRKDPNNPALPRTTYFIVVWIWIRTGYHQPT